MSENHLSETEYASLPLSEDLQRGIQETGFKFCTPIQALSLPIALQGKDVSGQAQTGTGKTAAFLIATFETLTRNALKKAEDESKAKEAETKENSSDESGDTATDENATDAEKKEAPKDIEKEKPKASKKSKNPIKSIMIAPTRELAKQIYDDAKGLNKFTKYKLALAYGGTDYDKQRDTIAAGCDVLIGTPGRIIDYYKQGVFSLDQLEVLVMDEADRMFDMGFIDDIRYLLRGMPEPKNRQSLLFSATMSQRVKELAYEHMNSPETVVVVSEQVTADKVEQIAYMPPNEEKIPLTLGILRANSEAKSIIFINTKYKGEELQRWLEANEFKSGILSGDVPQKKRERLLQDFKDNKINCLVATDVAARGLHIDGVETVINFDLPNDAEDYVHRIGRTARAGTTGKALSLICETFGLNIMAIEEYIDSKIPLGKDYSEFLATDLVTPKPVKREYKKTDKKPARNAKSAPSKQGNQQNREPSKREQESRVKIEQPDAEEAQLNAENANRKRYMRKKNLKKEVPLIG